MSAWLVQISVSQTCTRLWKRGVLDGHSVHRDLMRLAEDDLGDQPRKAAGLLWRAEESSGGLRILAQISTAPLVQRLHPDFARTAQQRRLDPLLDALTTGLRVRYRIDANATKRHGNSVDVPAKKGKIANLRGTAADEWWLRRATDSGLQPEQIVSTSLPDLLGPPTRDRHNKPQVVRHAVTRFEGHAVVTDPDRLRLAVQDGIGRARTYGCGLLSLGPT